MAAAPSIHETRALSARVAAGDDRAFDVLVGHHRGRLVRIAAQIAPSGAAEDAVQIAMLNAHTALRRGFMPDDISAWLTTLCRNAAVDRLRRQAPVEPLSAASARGTASASTIAEARAELRDVLGAVALLPEDERDALMLRAVDGAGHHEIGLELGVTPGQARQLLYRARRRLREASLLVIPAWIPYRAEEAKAAAMRLFDPVVGPLSSPLRAVATLATTAAVGTAGAVVAPVVLSPVLGSTHQRAEPARQTAASNAAGDGGRVFTAAGRQAADGGAAASGTAVDANTGDGADASDPSKTFPIATGHEPAEGGSAPASGVAPNQRAASSGPSHPVGGPGTGHGGDAPASISAPTRERSDDEDGPNADEPSPSRSSHPEAPDEIDEIDPPEQLTSDEAAGDPAPDDDSRDEDDTELGRASDHTSLEASFDD